jgi:hypothetical protein
MIENVLLALEVIVGGCLFVALVLITIGGAQ